MLFHTTPHESLGWSLGGCRRLLRYGLIIVRHPNIQPPPGEEVSVEKNCKLGRRPKLKKNRILSGCDGLKYHQEYTREN